MKEIELSGKSLPVFFSVNVVEAVQKRYGEITELSEKLRDMAEVKWILAQVVNAGLEFKAYMNNIPAEKITPEYLGAIMSIADTQRAVDVIVEEFCEGLGTEKNQLAGDLGMIASLTEEQMSK